MSIVELFCHVDDFCNAFEPHYQAALKAAGLQARQRPGELCLSEIMTILIGSHQSHYRNFKVYDLEHVCRYQRAGFPRLVSYSRFVALIPDA